MVGCVDVGPLMLPLGGLVHAEFAVDVRHDVVAHVVRRRDAERVEYVVRGQSVQNSAGLREAESVEHRVDGVDDRLRDVDANLPCF